MRNGVFTSCVGPVNPATPWIRLFVKVVKVVPVALSTLELGTTSCTEYCRPALLSPVPISAPFIEPKPKPVVGVPVWASATPFLVRLTLDVQVVSQEL